MIHHSPISCQILENSYQMTTPVSLSAFNIFLSLSGNHSYRIENSLFESQKSFAFISSSSVSLSLNGIGKASLITCGQSFLREMLKTSFGKQIIGIIPTSDNVPYKGFKINISYQSRLNQLISDIAFEINLNRGDSLHMIHIHLYELLLLLKRSGFLNKDELIEWTGVRGAWNMNEVLIYIDENFDCPFSLDDLASRCALNSSYFSRSFKEHAGIPLFEYINRLRIQRACQLLKNSQISILEIAMTVGYNNVSFFNRYFKKIHNMSPGEYRKSVNL